MTWHNQVVILKMQLQQLAIVIGSGLIQVIKPVVMQINSALSGLIKFAQNVVNALGKIFGWKMEVNTKGLTIDDDAFDIDYDDLEGAADAADDASDGLDKATKAAKKFNDQLQGFDKLNVLRTTDTTSNKSNSNKNKNNGSDASNAAKDAVSGGEATAALKKVQGEFQSSIDNLYDLGRYIGDKIKDALSNIEWDKVYKAAENFGKGLADFLNGLVETPGLFAKIGETVAGALNTVLHFLDSFGRYFHWDSFGKSLAEGLNAFLKNIHWSTALSAAKNWGSGIGTALASFIKEGDFKEVGKAIAMAIKTVLTFWLSLGSSIPWKDIGKALADTVNGVIENIPAKELANTIDAWVQGIFDMLVTAVTHVEWGKLAKKIKELIKNLDFRTVEIVVGTLALLAGTSFAVTISNAIIAATASMFVDMLAKKLLAIMPGHAALSNAMSQGLGASVLQGISTPVMIAVGAFAALAAGLAYVYATNEEVRKSFADAVGVIKEALQPALDFLRTTVLPDLKNGFQKLVDILTPFGDFLRDVFTSIWMDMIIPALKRFGEEVLPPLVNALKNLWQNILVPIANFVAGVVGVQIKNMSDALSFLWKNIIVPLAQLLGGAFITNLKAMANGFDAAVKVVSTVISWIQKLKGVFDTIVTTIGKFVDEFKKAFGGIDLSTKSILPGLQTFIEKGFKAIYGFITNPFKTVVSYFSGIWKDIKKDAVEGVGGIQKDVVQGFKDMIKWIKDKLFPVSIGKLFKFQLPSFEFDTKTLQLANLSITYPSGVRAKWNRKAYDNPLMFNTPTVIPTMAGFQGFGDGPGGEMVYGHKNLMDDIREASNGDEMAAIGNRQLANDQKIIQLLGIIAEKEFGISSDALFRSVRDQASNYTTRTGKQAFEF